MTAVYALRRQIKLSFACTSWRKEGIFEGIWSQMRPVGEMRFRLKYEFLRWKVAIRGSKSTPSNRQFESCGVVFARKNTNRTAKHSALA